MNRSTAKRFVDSLAREVGFHREMLNIVGGREKSADDQRGGRPELGLAESLCLAARMRGALTSALVDAEHGGGVFEALESLPADAAARAAELRREFERVLAALSETRRAGDGAGALPS